MIREGFSCQIGIVFLPDVRKPDMLKIPSKDSSTFPKELSKFAPLDSWGLVRSLVVLHSTQFPKGFCTSIASCKHHVALYCLQVEHVDANSQQGSHKTRARRGSYASFVLQRAHIISRGKNRRPFLFFSYPSLSFFLFFVFQRLCPKKNPNDPYTCSLSTSKKEK